MKNLLLFCLIVLSLAACTNENTALVEDHPQIDETLQKTAPSNFTPLNIPFPEGTSFDIIGSELHFKLPASYYIVGIDAHGNYHKTPNEPTGSVTCYCPEGKGCHPGKFGGKYGCLILGGCGSCERTDATLNGLSFPLIDFAIFNADFDLFVENFEEIEGKYLMPNSLLDYKEIKDLVKELQSNFITSQTNKKTIVFINAFGYILPLEIPADMDNTSLRVKGNSSGVVSIRCDCNDKQEDAKCPRKQKMGISYCNADNCASCTLTGRVINEIGEVRDLKADGGLITLTK